MALRGGSSFSDIARLSARPHGGSSTTSSRQGSQKSQKSELICRYPHDAVRSSAYITEFVFLGLLLKEISSNIVMLCVQDMAFRRGLVLVTSQKSLSVAALIIPKLAGDKGGIPLLVCVFVYLLQLAIDFWMVSLWDGQRSGCCTE